MAAPGRVDWWIDMDAIAMFVAVLETGGFSRAAARVHRSQPTVSNRIRSLEKAVGARLLIRKRRGVRPTHVGRVLYEQGRGLLSSLEAARQRVAGCVGGTEGDLVVAASTIPGTYLLPGALARFRTRHPNVALRVTIGNSEDVVRRVREGSADLGVVGIRPPEAGLSVKAWRGDRIVVAVPEGHPWCRRPGAVSLRELREAPLIVREPGSGTRRVVERELAKRHLRLSEHFRIVCEVGSTEGIREAVCGGLGVGFISDLAVKRCALCSEIRIRDIKDLPLDRPFYLIRKDGDDLPDVLGIFLKFLAADPPQGSPMRPSRRKSPSRIVHGCGGHPGT